MLAFRTVTYCTENEETPSMSFTPGSTPSARPVRLPALQRCASNTVCTLSNSPAKSSSTMCGRRSRVSSNWPTNLGYGAGSPEALEQPASRAERARPDLAQPVPIRAPSRNDPHALKSRGGSTVSKTLPARTWCLGALDRKPQNRRSSGVSLSTTQLATKPNRRWVGLSSLQKALAMRLLPA